MFHCSTCIFKFKWSSPTLNFQIVSLFSNHQMENPSLAKHVHVCILILKLRTLITNLPTGIFTHQCSALSLYPSNGVTYQYLSPFNEAPLPSNDVLQICVVYPFRKKETCPPIKYPYTPLGYPDLPKEGESLPSNGEPLLPKGVPFTPI